MFYAMEFYPVVKDLIKIFCNFSLEENCGKPVGDQHTIDLAQSFSTYRVGN